MAGGIDDVDVVGAVGEGGVFGADGDAFFTFKIHGIHHALGYLLVGTEGARLAEELVNEGRFSVVDVSDDGNVTDVLHGELGGEVRARVKQNFFVLQAMSHSKDELKDGLESAYYRADDRRKNLGQAASGAGLFFENRFCGGARDRGRLGCG